ncbi:hypothetical protein Tco_0045254 [Tanacetum coccineum]
MGNPTTNQGSVFFIEGEWRGNQITPLAKQVFGKQRRSNIRSIPAGIDIISVQATSGSYESAFSTSGEMCMCLKDHLGAQERKQHKSGLENPIDFEEENLDAEVQQNKVIPLSEEEIALDVASSEDTMFGSGSGGEEVDYDMTNYGYDDYE